MVSPLRVLFLLLCLSLPLTAQEVTGSILGTITDPTGAPVPNASVKVLSTERGAVVRSLTTDSDGNYVATLLPIGFYALSVEAPGFKRAKRDAIELHVGEKLTHNLKLELGDVAQEVIVEAEVNQVQLQNATAEGLISGQEVRELSLNNRN
ncbi:MAG: carboxypeptidase-like regulatory domain-containing protein, partial [Bryobacteraceae bacterium]|nr:carboxypeptidase-like regulatory domain-containing protein [Bryobacteraceae bacterium]